MTRRQQKQQFLKALFAIKIRMKYFPISFLSTNRLFKILPKVVIKDKGLLLRSKQ